jgi:ABC-type siderophore export system fused ATPase/permease subunit
MSNKEEEQLYKKATETPKTNEELQHEVLQLQKELLCERKRQMQNYNQRYDRYRRRERKVWIAYIGVSIAILVLIILLSLCFH